MIKNSFKTSFLTIEFEELFNGVLTDITDIFKEPMSDDKLPFISVDVDDIETILNDLSEIDPNSPTQYPTDEELQEIHQVEQQLINICSPSSNDTTIQPNVSELLNPNDVHLYTPAPEEAFVGSQIQNNSITQLPQPLSPLSPDSQMSHSMNTLSIEHGNNGNNGSVTVHQNQVIYNTNLVMIPTSPLELSSCLPTEPSVRYRQRIRSETYSGPYHNIGDNPMISLPNTSFIESTAPPMTATTSNRGPHSALPYVRSSTDPLPFQLPGFRTTFGSTHGPESNQNFENMSMPSTSGYTSTNYLRQNSGPNYSTTFSRSQSEPVLPQPISYRSSTNRGRPPSRPHLRRQPTVRQRQENLENELTQIEVRNYQLNLQFRYVLSSVQHFRQRLTELGFTPEQMVLPRTPDQLP